MLLTRKKATYRGQMLPLSWIYSMVLMKEFNVSNNDVLVIEDIVDTGKTLKKLVGYLKGKSPKSLKVCGMFDKPERRSVEFEPDYIGRSIPDKFIVGYGLDYAEKFRNLPYVAVVEEETV